MTRRIARLIGITTVYLTITITLAWMCGLINTYNGQNAGITIGTHCTGIGIEYRGNPGIFTNLCQ